MGPYRKGSKNTKPKKPKKKPKARNFKGNQHTTEKNTCFTSSSAQKLSTQEDFDVKCDEGFNFVIIAFSFVFSKLAELLCCKTCHQDISFAKTGIRGLGFKIVITCGCGDRYIHSCQLVNKSYEINRRIVFVMRIIGVGFRGLFTFCSLMDMTSMSKTLYHDILNNVAIATHSVANTCLKKAGSQEKEQNKERGLPEDEFVVSGDGTWCKRGFSSLIGVTTVVGKYTRKVLDYFVSSKTCKSCDLMRAKLNRVDFDIWYESDHKNDCSINYEGSSGGMEVQGIISIFQNSLTLHNAKYSHYIGDGDSKTFTNLLDAKPYGDFIVKKLECVLHVGKRMYRHLKELKKTLTNIRKIRKAEAKKQEEANPKKEPKKISQPRKRRKKNDPPPPPPPVKTTDLTMKIMGKMSKYYALAIQRNPESVEDMTKEIWAIFYHAISTDAKPQHHKCNAEWCPYLKAQANKEVYKHKPALNDEVQEYLKPVFEKLTDPELLKRCVGKNTQNNNECFNGCLWMIVPKHIFVGHETIEIATQIALAVFNEGRITILKMMEIMGCTIGRLAYAYAQKTDEERIARAEKAAQAATKEGRSLAKEAKREQEQSYIDQGLMLYGPGIAD